MFLEDEGVYGSEICAVINEVCYLILEEEDKVFQCILMESCKALNINRGTKQKKTTTRSHCTPHRNSYSSTDIPLKLTPRTMQPESNRTAATTTTKWADPFGVEFSAIRSSTSTSKFIRSLNNQDSSIYPDSYSEIPRKAATRFRRTCPLFNSMQMKTGERPGWDFLRVVSSGHLFQKYGRMDHTEEDHCDGQVQEESGST
ncbi:hypothetical protein CDAR_613861 [Caerostris darwini]|uniref:Uncharacterized protein n=1 Tax=Caerostris darwini TaxID=1538125 RepID=A0AAV4MH97_9ARAC|nr:hypothetical protein CDAR_613861 [Caerostris darwini]